MTFAEAIQSILDGKHVTRPCWKDAELSIYLPTHRLMGNKVISSYGQYVDFTREDLEATDWEEIVPDWLAKGYGESR